MQSGSESNFISNWVEIRHANDSMKWIDLWFVIALKMKMKREKRAQNFNSILKDSRIIQHYYWQYQLVDKNIVTTKS